MQYRLGIVGGGNMGGAIARGAVRRHVLRPEEVIVAEALTERHSPLADIGCAVVADPAAVLEAEQVLLAVKPQSFTGVAESIAPLPRPMVVVTIMAGIGTDQIRGRLGDNARVIRAMPNTPCQLGEGMTGIALGEGARPGDETFARQIFEALGRTVMLDESLMHAVTAVSGSGPAYVYYLAELMQQAAIDIGLDPRDAELLVVQTIIGAGRMLREADMEPAELRKIVTTPGGTTAAALDVMHSGALPQILIDALKAARDRGVELGQVD